MRFLILFILAFAVNVVGQPAIQRTPLTTNQYMVLTPSDGHVPVWNGSASRWSNAPAASVAGGTFNINQFSAAGTTNIKKGALITNTVDYFDDHRRVPYWANITSRSTLVDSNGTFIATLRYDANPNRGIYWGDGVSENAWMFHSFQLLGTAAGNTDPRFVINYDDGQAGWGFREFELVGLTANQSIISYDAPGSLRLGSNNTTPNIRLASTNVFIDGTLYSSNNIRGGRVSGAQWNSTNQGLLTFVYGSNNMARSPYSTISGGYGNAIMSNNAAWSFIGGGSNNTVGAFDADNAIASVVAGGQLNRAGSNYTFVGGGENNRIDSEYSVIVGGINNIIGANSSESTIGGGNGNDIDPAAFASTIAGGYQNDIQSRYGTVGGGRQNMLASVGGDVFNIIAGGYLNYILSTNSFIGGGERNSIGRSKYAVINGGLYNEITNSIFGAILGGTSNRINGAEYATVAGNDQTNTINRSVLIGPTHTNFIIVKTNGVGINTNNPLAALHVNGNVLVNGWAFLSGSVTNATNSFSEGTNVNNWTRYPLLTATRALVLDSANGVAVATGTPDGTKFLRDDNTYAVPVGSDAASNVWLFASSGSGTTNDPYINWDKNLIWGPRTKYNFGGFAYLYTNAPNWGHEQLELYGKGATLLYRGTGLASNAVSLISTSTYTYRVTMRDFFIDGGTNATTAALNGVYVESMDHADFKDIRVKNVRSAGMLIAGATVLSKFDNFHCSQNWDYLTNTAVGTAWVVEPTNGLVLNGAYNCDFPNLVLERLPGMGLLCNTSQFCWFTGSSEGNAGGMQLGSGSKGNWVHMAFEQNTTNDLFISSDDNTFEECYSLGLTTIVGGKRNSFTGGTYEIIDNRIGTTGTSFQNIIYDNLTNSGSATILLNIIDDGGDGVPDTNQLSTTAFLPVTGAGRPSLIARKFFQGTGNLQEWQDSDNSILSTVRSNGFLGILTNSPKAPLHVNGSIYAGNGSAVQPSFTWGEETNAGFYRVGANNYGFSSAGDRKWVISDTILAFKNNYSFGWYSPGFAALDVSILRHGDGTNAFANAAAIAGTGSLYASNANFLGQVKIGPGTTAQPLLLDTKGSANASVGGTLIVSNGPIASAGAAETNLITATIPAHTLTNTNDRLIVRASGRFAANANAKDLKLVYGSETIFDTTSQVVNSGAWTIEAEIIRTGNTAQTASAEFHGAGVTLFTTAAAVSLAQTNGIDTVLKITSTAAGDGDVTNRSLTVTWYPSP